jgi:hypothetical protein
MANLNLLVRAELVITESMEEMEETVILRQTLPGFFQRQNGMDRIRWFRALPEPGKRIRIDKNGWRLWHLCLVTAAA